MALTPKQENFCLAYLETGNASIEAEIVYDIEGSETPRMIEHSEDCR